MISAEFKTKAKDNIIEIPDEYKNLHSKNLKVKIELDSSGKINTEGIKKLYGALKDGANPKLVKEEDKAWEKAVKEKYGNR